MLPTENSDNHPKHLICPISLLIFKEPVTVAPSGMVYEWEEIETVIALAKSQGKQPLCPKTKMPLTGYVKAFNILEAVEDYLQAHPDAVKDQYVKSKAETLPNTPVRINHDEPAPVRRLGLVPQDPSADDRVAIAAAQAALNAAPRRDISRQVREMAARSAALHNVDGDYSPRAMVHRLINNNAQEELRRYELFQNLHGAVQASGATQPLFGGQRDEERERRRHVREERERIDREERERLARERSESEARRRERVRQAIAALPPAENIKRESLITDIQELIYALKFEVDKRIRDYPLPWEKIAVAEGPVVPEAMHDVLLTAIKALKELNPDLLRRKKEKYQGQYDRVRTRFNGEKSLGGGGYVGFAKAMGTIKNQPGYLIDNILIRVDLMLNDLCKDHANQVQRVVRP